MWLVFRATEQPGAKWRSQSTRTDRRASHSDTTTTTTTTTTSTTAAGGYYYRYSAALRHVQVNHAT